MQNCTASRGAKCFDYSMRINVKSNRKINGKLFFLYIYNIYTFLFITVMLTLFLCWLYWNLTFVIIICIWSTQISFLGRVKKQKTKEWKVFYHFTSRSCNGFGNTWVYLRRNWNPLQRYVTKIMVYIGSYEGVLTDFFPKRCKVEPKKSYLK